MSVLFLSHASADDLAAGTLETWLQSNGFTDIFVDHHSILGGERWTEALRASAGACRVVACLVTDNWLKSNECFNEFLAAWYMGKRIIPLYCVLSRDNLGAEAKQRLDKVRAEYQGIKFDSCTGPNGTLNLDADPEISNRLKEALRAAGAIVRIGLDPRVFPVDRARRPFPFPGLASFSDDDADAALFYGRSREIADTLEDLRKMRAERDKRPFVIMGASGAGKSSLLKAGIIPRLRREAPAWLPLRAFRPGADPLLNFAEALSRTYADFGKTEAHGVIRDRLMDAWSNAERNVDGLTVQGNAALAAVLEAEGNKLREAAGRTAASILISIDQAEELARADGASGDALADYLRVALAETAGVWYVAFAIRTDSFPELQSHRRFQNLQARGYDLRAIPVFRFDSVVEEPAKLYGVEVAPDLLYALMDDAPKEDALPLLAFALQRLWRQYADSGNLTIDNYRKVGGLKGLIEDSAERALRGIEPEQDVPLPSVPLTKRLDELGTSTFVPALAQVNETGATIRRVANWASFNEEQQELLQRFDHWRLVVRKSEAGGGTIEVAHEALFREWARLRSWFEPERARLDLLRSIQVDASTWNRNSRDPSFLSHRGKLLLHAREMIAMPRYHARLDRSELDYIDACADAERAARLNANLMLGAVCVLVGFVILGAGAWYYQPSLISLAHTFFTQKPFITKYIRPLPAATEQGLKPGDPPFRECVGDQGTDYCPAMIVVPAGSFQMGSPPMPNEGTPTNQLPQHQVNIAQNFAVSQYELTFAEWDTCVEYGDCNDPLINDGGWGRGNQPLINVSFEDVQTYVIWLSKVTGKQYSLLTEAEYEYAARGGKTPETAYPWGNEIGISNANCDGCGDIKWENLQPAPVGQFNPNGFQLYDMVGNVSEWVMDCYHDTYNNNPPLDGTAWVDILNCARVVRGGSWKSTRLNLYSAYRSREAVDYRNDNLGFRVARTLNQ